MGKMIKCKTCSKEIASKAKVCPECGAKNKKSFYKKWWFWLIILFVMIGAFGGEDSSNHSESNQTIEQEVDQVNKVEETTQKTENTTQVEEKVEENIPTEYKSALKKATTYSDIMNMSKAGVYDQLTSEYGEKFSPEAAQYAIDNVQVLSLIHISEPTRH